MKVLVALCSILVLAVCEPPVRRIQFVPANTNSVVLSGSYGVPSSGPKYATAESNQDDGFTQGYVVPGNIMEESNRSNEPITISDIIGNQQQLSGQYGVPTQNSVPSPKYGVPVQTSVMEPEIKAYVIPTQITAAIPPSQSYGVPSMRSNLGGNKNNGFARRPSLSNVRRPLPSYGPPNSGGVTGAIVRPNSEYGAQNFNGPQGTSNNVYLPQTIENGIGAYRYGRGGTSKGNHHDDGLSEPANYEYEYMVTDAHYANDFGHREARQKDATQGRYYVVLPDGRKQIVDYEADHKGYRPKVTYEGEANFNTNTGYEHQDSPSQSNAGGYETNSQYTPPSSSGYKTDETPSEENNAGYRY